jgi:hypothetical protein
MHYWEVFLWVLHSKLRLNKKMYLRTLFMKLNRYIGCGNIDILAVVSSLDCCLLAAPLSRACSFSSTTNKFFLLDFVANNFVLGENFCECLCLMNRTCSLWSDGFRHLSLSCIARNFNI